MSRSLGFRLLAAPAFVLLPAALPRVLACLRVDFFVFVVPTVNPPALLQQVGTVATQRGRTRAEGPMTALSDSHDCIPRGAAQTCVPANARVYALPRRGAVMAHGAGANSFYHMRLWLDSPFQ
ncbi:MAG: hypothetical protein ACE5JM_12175, partial [Armatimonadota bacterium]